MGIKDWLDGIMGNQPKVVGVSKGGSRLVKYGGHEFDRPRMGLNEGLDEQFVKRRESVYEDIFGVCDVIHHEMLPCKPHIDVHHIPPVPGREFHTFLTAGMSDLPMTVPEEVGAEMRRIELVIYTAENNPIYPVLLRRLAHFPHDNRTWIHWGHTMPNGNPPAPIFESGILNTLFFMPSILSPDSELGERLSHLGEPVNLVWCVPISSAECNLKLEAGTDALYDLFETHQHPFVFSGDRASYI